MAAPQRNPATPNVPTAAEGGLQNFEVSTWYAIFAVKGTPQPIVEVLNRALGESLLDPTVQTTLRALGQKPATPVSVAEAERLHREGLVVFRELARSTQLQ